MSLELAGVVWRSSWWLESRRSSIPRSSSSPVHLLRPAQTTFLKPIKGSGSPTSQKGKDEVPLTPWQAESVLDELGLRQILLRFLLHHVAKAVGDPRYLPDQERHHVLTARVLNLSREPPLFRSVSSTIVDEEHPMCSNLDF
ncbi:hypothetical protein Taro_049527 [Colocasia esculenta]|uniref:Uncharacterized protein n=1 Tax=Colocasia esculenta TaxID=4460 RepID=A0A843XB93_COLES|nr:hypothetical protein [Colocasia esculenta]